MFAITKKLKVGSEEGQIFNCSLHFLNLMKVGLLALMKKCARYEGLKIGCLYAWCVRIWNEQI